MRRPANQKGQVLIAAVVFLVLVLFLGLILVNHATGSLRLAREMDAHSQTESILVPLADGAALLTGHRWAEVIDLALLDAYLPSAGRWDAAQFEAGLQARLATMVATDLPDRLDAYAAAQYEAPFTFAVHSPDLSVDPVQVEIGIASPQTPSQLTLTLLLHKPSIRTDGDEPPGSGTYLQGPGELVTVQRVSP